MQQTRRNFLSYIVGGAIAISGVSGVISPLEAWADTIYYGKIEQSKKQNSAYIIHEDVKVKSKYYEKLSKMKSNDPDYYSVLSQLELSINNAVVNVASSNGYNVVVEKDDPEIKDYTAITQKVIEKMEKNEKK